MTKTLPIIGLTGPKYSGKTTAANHLIRRYGYGGSAITDPMIDIAVPILKGMGVPGDETFDRLAPSGTRKDDPIPNFPWLTGRKVLQAIGKDLRDALSQPTDTAPDGNLHGTDSRLFYDFWLRDNADCELLVNQSVRYAFEGGIITSEGGETWRIINPEAAPTGDTHESERQDWPVERTIIAPHSKGVSYLHSLIDEIMASAGVAPIS